jgi:hypothetical protein
MLTILPLLFIALCYLVQAVIEGLKRDWLQAAACVFSMAWAVTMALIFARQH